MKKIYLALIIGILLIGITFAGVGLLKKDRTIKLSVEDKDTLTQMNITNPKTSPIECTDKYCEVCLKDKNVVIVTRCSVVCLSSFV